MPAPTKLVFEEIEPKDMPTIYANSVIGGLGPRGDLVIILCREYPQLSVPSELPIADGKIQPALQQERTEIGIEREHVARLIIPISQIESIASWLTQQAASVKQNNVVVMDGG